MKKLFTSVLMAVMPLLLMAQGWPANYGGVMLQSFEWDGYDATKWSALTANSDELSQCFDLIWVPQSGFIPGDPASTPARSMGYNDVYWLKQDSYFGTETELRNMISTFKSKGTGIIADVVVNHKNGASNWTDFPNESKNGYTLTWNPLENICNTDEYNRSDQVKYGYATGEADTGDDFDGCRDLDHTNSKVQQNIITYQKFLLNDLGYAGIRLDMVKGYGGEYTKIYNQATNPTFSVGEYWDGDYNAVMNWVNATGKTSAAFDFPLKYIINEAVGNGNYGALSNKGIAGDPNNSRYSVTFADNHDTGQDGNGSRLTKDWSAANAVILAMPGTPCIWIKHYNVDKTSIKAMIFARRAAGVHNQSSIVEQQESNGGYIIRTRGTNGDVYVQLGGATNNGTPSGMKQVAQGDNYKFFCTSSLDITTPHKPGSITPTPTPTPDPTPSNVTVYFKNTQGWSSVNCYAYIDDSNNGEWPGAAMTYDADITVNGSKGWWKYTLPTGLENSNVIFNGDGNQYPGAMESGLAVGGSSMACDGTEWSAATVGGGDDPTPQPGGKTTIYVKSATAPYLYVWDGAGGEPNGAWPGAQMTQKDG
ncbi:MAG: starch-binding protein, partial [Prevotella sp.]|nr:starch-binding protein [Prevotella sp.]